MSRHDPAVTLKQMRDFALEGVTMIRGRTGVELASDSMLRLALERLVTVLGEAAARLPREWRDDHPQVPWQMMIGMRNRLIHGYDDIALETLWDTAEHDLPELIRAIELILAEAGESIEGG